MIFLISGFIIGIFTGSIINVTIGLLVSVAILSLIFFVYKNFVEEKNKRFILYGVFLLFGVFLGLGRMYFSDLNQESRLAQFVGEKVTAEGIIVEEPNVRESNTKLTVLITDINTPESVSAKSFVIANDRPTPAKPEFREKILITTNIYPEYNYGDKILLENLKTARNLKAGL